MSVLVSPNTLANTVIMVRTVDRASSALLIEGDKDTRIFRKVTDSTKCRLYAAGNRAQAEATLAILMGVKQPGVLAVVDADTDYLQGKLSTNPNLIITHTRDAECMLLSTPILKDILIEFDLPSDAFGPNPEQAAIEAAAWVGYARFAILKNRWQVRTSEIDFSKFIDPGNLKCGMKALCHHVTSLVVTPGLTSAELEIAITKLAAKRHDPFTVARGHDVCTMLAWAISHRSGKRQKDGAKIESYLIESYLRAVYPASAFALTDLFKEISVWEARNKPFLVLKKQ